jgi:hypothetical protein
MQRPVLSDHWPAPDGVPTADASLAVMEYEEIHSDEHEMVKAIGQLCEQLEARFGKPSQEGAFRRVYDAGDTVYKVPRSTQGARSCIYEAHVSERHSYGQGEGGPYPVAPCELLWTSEGVPFVAMEKVSPHGPTPRPEWAELIDQGQVGYSQARAAWVVFDAGCEIGHRTPPTSVSGMLPKARPQLEL